MPKSSDLNDFDFSGSESSVGPRNSIINQDVSAASEVPQNCSAALTNNSSSSNGNISGSGSLLAAGVAGIGSGCNANNTNGNSGNSSGNGSGVGGTTRRASNSGSDSKKYRHQSFSKNIYIGTKNAEKWDLTRQKLAFKNDVEFVTYLLNLAENDTVRSSSLTSLSSASKSFATIKLEPNLSAKDFDNSQFNNGIFPAARKKHGKRVQFQNDSSSLPSKSKHFSPFSMKQSKKEDHDEPQDQSISSSLDDENIPEVLDCRIAEKIKDELERKSTDVDGSERFLNVNLDNNEGAICLKKAEKSKDSDSQSDEGDIDEDDEDDYNEDDGNAVSNLNRDSNFRIRDRSKGRRDVRRAPLNGKLSNEDNNDEQNSVGKSSENEEDYEKDDDFSNGSKLNFGTRLIQSCKECTFSHDYEKCPLRNATENIADSIEFAGWQQHADRENEVKDNDQENDEDDDESTRSSTAMDSHEKASTVRSLTFSQLSLPPQLDVKVTDTTVGVFLKVDMPKFTRFGPLIGETVQANDIPDDCNMQHVFEIFQENKSEFISVENPNTSNWMRFVRIAPTYEERTVSVVAIEQKAYFVTCSDLDSGRELLYWSDECNSAWQKKYTAKINCGGCNIKFEHPIHYRTHCSIFHDPLFSLTIRKYHCKVCGEAVLGKENIMKHASQMHDGKGAYQCQFCKKFFLRLNYLEMHRTYGCSANPQRARPLCDFCGRKFCQPQKLKVHIKRMHSDMAEVLRDFQCKLCSKLLGSRAALQRHCKEVHSRNSTVVSCPRCQKLFQNRSNLKIHMLTHSGVRPFKCAESECTAAFTTKQCLQFHYKKVHNYSQEQMPKIERSVAYTFDAYSGGMKVDFLEQAPRRRRKSFEDQNSLLSSTLMDDSKSESDDSEDNIFGKKSGKSLKELCRDEVNLSHFSNKGPSIYNREARKRRKRKYRPEESSRNELKDDSQDEEYEQNRRKQNAQLSLVESFLSTNAQRLSATGACDHLDDAQKATLDQDEPSDQQQDTDNNFRHISNIKNTSNQCQNLVVSKGSKKWISDDDRHVRDFSADEATNKMIPTRDFLARFMMGNAEQNHIQQEEDENSTFLDVVDSNNPGQLSQFNGSQENQAQLQMNNLTHPQSFLNSFYNSATPRLTAGGATSTSASMLVEAALNSVGSMMENEASGLKCPTSSTLDSDSNINDQIQGDENRFNNSISNIESLENEIKMMKTLNTFPMQIPPIPMFQNASGHLNPCNISPDTSNANNSTQNASNNSNNNEIDVDSGSTPRGQQIGEQDQFSHHHQTPPSPQVISPGRDYAMFGSGNGTNGQPNANMTSSPLPTLHSRRNYSEHELISPASSPSIPRYDFSGDLCRKREHQQQQQQQQQEDRVQNNLSVQNQMSSDDENSIIAQNSTTSGQEMRMKFNSSQMDLMYSKYDAAGNSGIKYNNNQELDVAGFRSSAANNDLSDIQGLDMTSRTNIGSNYHHNFQLPSTTGTNLGLGRYHHHIYDILSEREQQQQHQQQQQQPAQELSMQHQTLHNILPEQMSDQDHEQTTSVDLSRTANYVVTSPPALPYSHPHHDMLRMVSLDLTPNTNIGVGNNRSFIPSQIGQHNSRDSLDHHRILSTAEQHRLLAASNSEQHRLLVDPTAHLLMEQNNRLLGSEQSRLLGDTGQNRHMVSTRAFGAYHQVTSGNYHPSVRPVLPSANHHAPNPSNYHPFPAYY